jgi:O-antigen/teichoic acid export membrane protein
LSWPPSAGAWREVTWILVGQAVAALGAVVGVRLISGALAPAAYGEFALGLTLSTLVAQVMLGPLANAFERFFAPSFESGQAQTFLATARLLTRRASAVILGSGALVCGALVVFGRSEWIVLAITGVTLALLSGWEGLVDSIQNARRQRRVVATHLALRYWLRPAVAFVLLGTLSATSSVAMLGYASASLIVLVSQLWSFRSFAQTSGVSGATQSPVLYGQMMSYATPFAVWGIFSWMQMTSDRWALQALGSAYEVGLLAVVTQLGGYPLSLLGTMLTQLAVPILFARAGSASDKARMKSVAELCALLAGCMLACTALVGVGAAAYHEQVFALAAGPQYQSESELLPLAVVSSGLFCVGQMLSLLPMAYARSRVLVAPKVATALLAVVLNAAGAYMFGLVGVLAAGVIFAFVYTAWVAIVARTIYVRRQFSQTNGYS